MPLSAWIALTVALVAPALAQPLDVTSEPAGVLTMSLDRETGAVTRLDLAGEAVNQPGPRGGFLVTDHAGDKSPQPFPVALTPKGAGIAFDGAQRGLRLSGRIEALSHRIEVSGVIEDTSGADRAVSLGFGLPVEPEGWRWSRDLYRDSPVRTGVARTNAIPLDIGTGSMDVWPLGAVQNGSVTLSLATRIDEPAVFHTYCDADTGLLGIQLDFALTDLAKKLPRKAPFRFAILVADTPLGLRSALNEYYQAFGELFVQRTDKLGGWFAWGDILELEPPLSDFGLMFHEGPTAEGAETDAKLGIPRYPYIEPGMFQLHFGDLDHQPSREEIMERLAAYADDANDPDTMAGLSERDAWNRTMSRAILKSGIRNSDGELLIAAVGQYSWVAGSRWAAQFPLLLDPDIPQGAAETYLEYMADMAPNPDWGEGRYLDSYSAHIRSVDYSPDALAVADFPPCFDSNLRPCQLMAIPMFEYVEKLGELLDPYGKAILVNAYDHPTAFPFHRFDILGKEHWVSGSGKLLERYRCMAFRKIVTDLPAYAALSTDALQEFLLYNVYPGGYARGNWGQEEMRMDYRRIIPLLRLESRLGWEPVTGVNAGASEVRVERYGNPPGPVLLAVYNPLGGKIATLDIGRRAVGENPAQALELLSGKPLDWSPTAEGMTLRLPMGPGETSLVALGNQTAFSELYGLLAADKLDDIDLCLREWPLRENQEHPQAREIRAALDAWRQSATASLPKLEPAEHPLNKRITQLAPEVGDLLAKAADPPVLSPVPDLQTPEVLASGAPIPWAENFDTLDADRWIISDPQQGIKIEDGKLTMRLPETGARALGITSRESFDFGARPLEFKYRFQFNHAGHQWYLMQSFNLIPSSSGRGDDFLHIRCDPGARMRVENGDTPASGYRVSLTPYQDYGANVPHEVSLLISAKNYRLLIDGQLHGEGPHDLGFTTGYVSLGLYSGHNGHGDVCWFDDLEVCETDWEG